MEAHASDCGPYLEHVLIRPLLPGRLARQVKGTGGGRDGPSLLVGPLCTVAPQQDPGHFSGSQL